MYSYLIVVFFGVLFGMTNKDLSVTSLLIGIFTVGCLISIYLVVGTALNFDIVDLALLKVNHHIKVQLAFFYAIEFGLVIKLLRKFVCN